MLQGKAAQRKGNSDNPLSICDKTFVLLPLLPVFSRFPPYLYKTKTLKNFLLQGLFSHYFLFPFSNAVKGQTNFAKKSCPYFEGLQNSKLQ